jgi:hypothetical protein
MKSTTLNAKVTDFSLVKPGELIDVIELTPLKLIDKRLFNELLANAWEEIEEGKEHRISKKLLKSMDKNLDRLGESLTRLQSTVVITNVLTDGSKGKLRFNFLYSSEEPAAGDGSVRYKFHPEMIKLLHNSAIFARIQREVMFALGSRYALSLYEILAKRVNLRHLQSEVFEVDIFRGLLGVPDGKYKKMAHLRERVLDTAFGEVGQLTEIGCSYQLIRNSGKGFTHIKVNWFPKDPAGKYEAEQKRKLTKLQQMAERSDHADLLRTQDKALRSLRRKQK